MSDYKIDGKNVQSVVPWSASGPGWSNQGVTINFYSPTGSYVGYESVTLYEKDLDRDTSILFSHALSVYRDFEKLVMRQMKAERIS